MKIKNMRFIILPCLLVAALLFANADAELEHECTTWLAFHDITGNDTNLLHKNRDAKYRNLSLLLSPESSPIKWVALGDTYFGKAPENPCMGMNEKGLAAAMNSGEKCTDNSTNPKGRGTPDLLRDILSHCSTAKEALEMLKGFVQKNDYSHGEKGSIFFFVDKDEAYIAEMTAHFISPMRYDRGYAFRANIWHNPGMAAYADNTIATFLNSANREYMVITSLNQALRSRGKVTVQDCIDLSRHYKLDNTPIQRRVCSKSTNSAATMEIDREFPAVLSTIYVLIGHPRHTICVPAPVCITKRHPKMPTREWNDAAWRRFDAQGPEADIPAEWLAFEKSSLEKYHRTQDEARKLMRAGKHTEAESLLEKTTLKIWDSAAKALGL